MKWAIVVIRKSKLSAERETSEARKSAVQSISVQLHDALTQLNECRRDLSKFGQQISQSSAQLSTAQALGAEKQREIANMRAQLAERESALKAARDEAREERQKLMDWIAKGVSNGVPIFAEMPLPVVTDEAPAPQPAPGTERIPSDVEEAIAVVGRRPRAIVDRITKKNDVDFEAAMKGAGVKRVFAEDRAVAQAEAVVISETKSA
jgi:seryl-tRNA synthetase